MSDVSVSQGGVFGEVSGYFTTSDLKRRGWTRRLIDRFLGEPDAFRANPHVRRGRPMKLFDVRVVKTVESDPWFTEESAMALQRVTLFSRVSKAKSENLLRVVDAIAVRVPDMPLSVLQDQARAAFGLAADEAMAKRHQLSVLVRDASASGWLLDDYFWHTGIRQARQALRRKILCAAIEKYPHLADSALEWSRKEKGDAHEVVVV